ncbi:unnamed protein product [Dicrocoelium dendriticum]|nr:unnamed protein product [Dicrocoelium dendriticum]
MERSYGAFPDVRRLSDMPEIIVNGSENSTGSGTVPQVRWLDQQQYLIETYRQIRTNLGQLEAEIEAARLRVTDWSQQRRQPSRSRSLSHASSLLSCSTDGQTTGSSCRSSCSSTCGIQLPGAVAASLNAATLISAFMAASASPNSRVIGSIASDEQTESNQRCHVE